MKRALIVTTVSGFVPQYEMNNVHILQEMGYEVHYASNFHNPHYGFDNHRLDGTGIICHQVDFVRSPFRIVANVKAYRQLNVLLQEYLFDLMHCHTPMGGVLGRLAAERFRRKHARQKYQRSQDKHRMEKYQGDAIKVFYTAHGFHFFRGAPLVNWILYYPVERWLAYFTDVLITINEEDYQKARKFRLRKSAGKRGKVKKVSGVGINLESYRDLLVNKERKRKELGIPLDACILISVGELTKRKNHQIVIKALAMMKKECEEHKVRYLICGEGAERKRLTNLIRRNHLTGIVTLLGYRVDIKEILAASDSFIFPSRQEGLPVALLEAKAMGLPCICSNIRGNRELVNADEMVKKNQSKAYKEKINSILKKGIMGERIHTGFEKYSQEIVMRQMRTIYSEE